MKNITFNQALRIAHAYGAKKIEGDEGGFRFIFEHNETQKAWALEDYLDREAIDNASVN